jgi:hypothetical protein
MLPQLLAYFLAFLTVYEFVTSIKDEVVITDHGDLVRRIAEENTLKRRIL